MSPGADLTPSEPERAGVVAAAQALLWSADPSGAWTWASAEWTDYTGLSAPESLGPGWLAGLAPDDRRIAAAAWRDATRTGTFAVQAGVLRREGADAGGPTVLHFSASAHRAPDGAILGWSGVALPLAAPASRLDLRAAEELQRQLRNSLAVIRSVARRTALTSDTIEHYATHFEGRLDALARIQNAAIRASDGGVDLESLVAEEMVAHRVEDAQVTIDGPALRLHPASAEVLGLAIHELVINAIKFGALGQESGAVALRWSVDASLSPPHLRLSWRETGVSVAGPAPRRKGFGSELIEKSLPYEVDAVTSLDFLPGGIRCRISVPLTDGIVLPAEATGA